MSLDEAALFAAVLAEPEDDTPRLVYADWLDEHGRTDRADLIRVQCWLEQTRRQMGAIWPSRVRWAERREQLSPLAERIRGELPTFPYLTWGPVTRGFVGEVKFHIYIDQIPPFVGFSPLVTVRVSFRPRPSGLAPLLAWSGLTTVPRIVVEPTEEDDRWITQLVQHAWGGRPHSLDLSPAALHRIDLGRLADVPTAAPFPRLVVPPSLPRATLRVLRDRFRDRLEVRDRFGYPVTE